jgi:uridine phosphorylase
MSCFGDVVVATAAAAATAGSATVAAAKAAATAAATATATATAALNINKINKSKKQNETKVISPTNNFIFNFSPIFVFFFQKKNVCFWDTSTIQHFKYRFF